MAHRTAAFVGRHAGWSGGIMPAVLMYHSVSPYDSDPYLVTVSSSRFERQMRWLRRRGLRGASVAELLAARDERLAVIAARDADLAETDRPVLDAALSSGVLELTGDPGAVSAADAVIICVPTPVDEAHVPDLAALRGACASVVAAARPGQTIVLTSTTYVGTTRELLTEPLAARGLRAGEEVFVAFSPERIDPGNPDHAQRETPRVVGGVTPACAQHAALQGGRGGPQSRKAAPRAAPGGHTAGAGLAAGAERMRTWLAWPPTR